MSGIGIVEVPTTSPASSIEITVPEVVRAGPPSDMVAPFATSVP